MAIYYDKDEHDQYWELSEAKKRLPPDFLKKYHQDLDARWERLQRDRSKYGRLDTSPGTWKPKPIVEGWLNQTRPGPRTNPWWENPKYERLGKPRHIGRSNLVSSWRPETFRYPDDVERDRLAGKLDAVNNPRHRSAYLDYLRNYESRIPPPYDSHVLEHHERRWWDRNRRPLLKQHFKAEQQARARGLKYTGRMPDHYVMSDLTRQSFPWHNMFALGRNLGLMTSPSFHKMFFADQKARAARLEDARRYRIVKNSWTYRKQYPEQGPKLLDIKRFDNDYDFSKPTTFDVIRYEPALEAGFELEQLRARARTQARLQAEVDTSNLYTNRLRDRRDAYRSEFSQSARNIAYRIGHVPMGGRPLSPNSRSADPFREIPDLSRPPKLSIGSGGGFDIGSRLESSTGYGGKLNPFGRPPPAPLLLPLHEPQLLLPYSAPRSVHPTIHLPSGPLDKPWYYPNLSVEATNEREYRRLLTESGLRRTPGSDALDRITGKAAGVLGHGAVNLLFGKKNLAAAKDAWFPRHPGLWPAGAKGGMGYNVKEKVSTSAKLAKAFGLRGFAGGVLGAAAGYGVGYALDRSGITDAFYQTRVGKYVQRFMDEEGPVEGIIRTFKGSAFDTTDTYNPFSDFQPIVGASTNRLGQRTGRDADNFEALHGVRPSWDFSDILLGDLHDDLALKHRPNAFRRPQPRSTHLDGKKGGSVFSRLWDTGSNLVSAAGQVVGMATGKGQDMFDQAGRSQGIFGWFKAKLNAIEGFIARLGEEGGVQKAVEDWAKSAEEGRKKSQSQYDDRTLLYERRDERKFAFGLLGKSEGEANVRGRIHALNKEFDTGSMTIETYTTKARELRLELVELTKAEKRLEVASQRVGGVIANTFEDALFNSRKMMKNLDDLGFRGSKLAMGMQKLGLDLLQVGYNELVTKPLAGAVTGGVKKLAGKVAGFFEKKAGGGDVWGGKPYVVGEKGAELFVPRQSGQIIPNHMLGSGQAIYITNYWRVDSVDGSGIRAAVSAVMPTVTQMAAQGAVNIIALDNSRPSAQRDAWRG